jgi:hypothetical protein
VANESAYHHRNWTSRRRANVLHPRPENQAALSQELDQMQGAGQPENQAALSQELDQMQGAGQLRKSPVWVFPEFPRSRFSTGKSSEKHGSNIDGQSAVTTTAGNGTITGFFK